MNTTLLVALALLAFPACSIREPTRQARTPAQFAALLRTVRWWQPAAWVLYVGVGGFAMAAWWALRSVAFIASALGAWLLAKTATATAADGRRYRLARSEGWVLLPS